MKYTFYFLFICGVAILTSCKKHDTAKVKDGFVKTVDSLKMDEQIGMITLDDGTFVIISNSQLINLDDKGKVAWRKPITEIKYVLAAASEPGSGFILIGDPVNPPTANSMYACRYLSNGNLLEKKQVNLNYPAGATQPPACIIRLAYGGFAVAMSSNYSNVSYLKILDHDFNLKYSRVILSPVKDGGVQVQHMCEMPNGDIAISIIVGKANTTDIWLNAAIYLTKPDGTIKSISILGDSVSNHVAHVLSTCEGGFFAASSTKTSWLDNTGSFVSYYGIATSQLAGTMQIERFNSDGQYTGNQLLSGYNGYGVIKSIRRTSDGGYLLCGSVGNNGSSLSVSDVRVFVCRLDPGLNQIWSKTLETTYSTIGIDAFQTPDGGCLITGNINSFDKKDRMILIKTDANGNY